MLLLVVQRVGLLLVFCSTSEILAAVENKYGMLRKEQCLNVQSFQKDPISELRFCLFV